MNTRAFLLWLSVTFIIGCSFHICPGQTQTSITVQPFWALYDSASYRLDFYLAQADEEQVSDTLRITHAYTARRIEASDERTIVHFTPDSISNGGGFEEDGERAMVLALFGLDVLLELDENGQYKWVLNKEDLIDQYISRLSRMPDSQKNQIKATLNSQEGEVFFTRLVEFNYMYLLNIYGKTYDLHKPIVKDSLVFPTDTTPSGIIKKRVATSYDHSGFKVDATETQASGGHSKVEGTMSTEYGDSRSDLSQTILLTDQGQIKSLRNVLVVKIPFISTMYGNTPQFNRLSSVQTTICEIKSLSY